MTDYGPRVVPREITLVGRSWNDVVGELQNLVNNLVLQSDVTNIVLSEMRISEGGGTTTVELPGSGTGQSYFHMGA